MSKIDIRKIKSKFTFECRNCHTTYTFIEGETVHTRCSGCGKSSVSEVVEGETITSDAFWLVRETGENMAPDGEPLQVVDFSSSDS